MMTHNSFYQVNLTITILLTMYMFNKYHIITSLIIAEFMTIIISFNMFLMLTHTQTEIYLVLFMLIIMISESVVGISMMVKIIRTHSNDFMKTMSMVKF